MAIYSIGQLAKETTCKIPTIRYYEEIDILPPATRSEGNQRRYNDSHLERLHFVLHCRSLGFSIEEIRQLIHLQTCDDHLPSEAYGIAQKHLLDILHKIEQLKLLASELQEVVNCCSIGGEHQCQILNVLKKPPVGNNLN